MSNNLTCITIERHEGKPLALVLRGDVNIFSATLLHELADTLLREQEDVVVSGEQLAHLDISTLQILLALRQGLWSQGRSLQLTGMSAELESLLQLTDVKNVLYSQVTAQCN